jgi:hypothetical protein
MSNKRISPEAMHLFLKQAALEDQWTTGYLAKALGIDGQTAKQLASEMALTGYVEAARGKKEMWRNAETGNRLAGARPPRLTRAKAEALLTDLKDRAAQFNLKESSIVRVKRVIALGGILTEHDPIQDIDIGVELDPAPKGQAQHAQEHEVLTALKGRSAALKLHVWNDALAHLPARVVWKA